MTNVKPRATYYVKVDNRRNERGGHDLGEQLDLAMEDKDAFEGSR